MSNYAVTCAKMKTLEQNTDAAGLSYYQMMENAGTIAADRIVEITMTSPINDACFGDESAVADEQEEDSETTSTSSIGDAKPDTAAEPGAAHRYAWQLGRPLRARVYCGKGNNGGDGLVVARLLRQRGWQVELILVDGEPVTPDAVANYELVKKLDIPVRDISDMSDPADAPDFSETIDPCERTSTAFVPPENPDVVVDAIYGTGFHGRLREKAANAADQIAKARGLGARVFALDIPSGMGGDLTEEAEVDPQCVRADVTITFHAKKPVHLQTFAKKYCGRIITADIGIVDPEQERAGAGDTEEKYGFGDFVEIISRLRAPDGCPWDREQTHETLKKYLAEETQEALEAIDKKDDKNLCEELGDVLLQIVLHAQIGRERGAFTINDVIQGVSEKMIRRHPWVFGDMQVSTPEEGERLWEQIKEQEKKNK